MGPLRAANSDTISSARGLKRSPPLHPLQSQAGRRARCRRGLEGREQHHGAASEITPRAGGAFVRSRFEAHPGPRPPALRSHGISRSWGREGCQSPTKLTRQLRKFLISFLLSFILLISRTLRPLIIQRTSRPERDCWAPQPHVPGPARASPLARCPARAGGGPAPPTAVAQRFDQILNNVIITTRLISQVGKRSPVRFRIRLLFLKNQLSLRSPLKPNSRGLGLRLQRQEHPSAHPHQRVIVIITFVTSPAAKTIRMGWGTLLLARSKVTIPTS